MSRDAVYEKVPLLQRRTGDNLLASQNNSTILLGRDRNGNVDSGYGNSKNAAAIHLTTGRLTEDPSTKNDAATVYISSKTDPDEQVGTTFGRQQKEVSAVILRGDCLRLTSRTDIKISVGQAYILMTSDGKIVIDGDISLKESASDKALKANAFAAFWNTVIVMTPQGPASPLPPLPQSVFSSIKIK